MKERSRQFYMKQRQKNLPLEIYAKGMANRSSLNRRKMINNINRILG